MELTEEEVKNILLSLTHISKEMYKAILTTPKHPPANGEHNVLVPVNGLKILADNLSALCTQLQMKNGASETHDTSTPPPGTTLN